jgi:hypothetical protein
VTREVVVSAFAGAEQRKEFRLQTELLGWMIFSQNTILVEIDDLSRSGARIFMDSPPPCGTLADLQIENFEPLSIKIVRSGHCLCAVEFLSPAPHQVKLLDDLLHLSDTV